MTLEDALEEAAEHARVVRQKHGKWHIETGAYDAPFRQPFEQLPFARDYLFAIRAIYATCKLIGIPYDYMLVVDALKLRGTPRSRTVELLRKKGYHDMDG